MTSRDRGVRTAHRSLTMAVAGTGLTLRPCPERLVIAGYTGRDEAAVRTHIAELAAIGVPEPATVPAFYELSPDLASTDDVIRVSGGHTSGEVEPVLLRVADRYYLGVGSDHTDRDREREDIAAAKAACAKPLGPVVSELPPDPACFDWDGIEIDCTVDGRPYQRGLLDGLRPPVELLSLLVAAVGDRGGDLVLFCGTIPLLTGDFVAGTEWRLRLTLPGGRVLEHVYRAEPDRGPSNPGHADTATSAGAATQHGSGAMPADVDQAGPTGTVERPTGAASTLDKDRRAP